eukprot:49818-Hanusia_phi.AAC.1
MAQRGLHGPNRSRAVPRKLAPGAALQKSAGQPGSHPLKLGLRGSVIGAYVSSRVRDYPRGS